MNPGALGWISALAAALLPTAATAQCVWPADLAAFQEGQVLTPADLNGRFDAIAGCMRRIPANVGDIADLDRLIQERVTAAVANLEFTAESRSDPTACDGAGGTTVVFRNGAAELSRTLVCNGQPGGIQAVEDLQITVGPGAEASDLATALTLLESRFIRPGDTVELRLQPGDHAVDRPLRVTQSNARQIAIIGDGVQPEDTRIVCANPDACLRVEGTELGLIANVRFERPLGARDDGMAIVVDAGQLHVRDVEIADFALGFEGIDGARTFLDRVTISSTIGYGLRAHQGSLTVANDLVLEGAQRAEAGIKSLSGSVVFAPGVQISGYTTAVHASRASSIHIEGGTLSDGHTLAYSSFLSGVFFLDGTAQRAEYYAGNAEAFAMIDFTIADVEDAGHGCLRGFRGAHIAAPGATLIDCDPMGLELRGGSTAHIDQAHIHATTWGSVASLGSVVDDNRVDVEASDAECLAVDASSVCE